MTNHTVVLATAAKPPPGLRPIILVAEDHELVRELLGRVLRARGFEVYAVDNGARAMKLATILRFDAAVVDLTMYGKISGLDLIAWLRSHRSYGDTLPVLILTGNTALSESVEVSIRALGAYVFYKGHSLKPLVDKLTQLTVHHAFGSPGLLPAVA